MTTWVLILVLHWYSGTASQAIDFSSKEACVAAGEKAKTSFWDFGINSSYICVAK